ncbi:hypothetical protein LUZ63_001610 [Rhynchospora breviuscula]|uniref:DUF7054 domain-containing protein n=1 Tax=Rhynchospora breviuscula TaxID=2022672 RepID=A0A9Q0HX83_9POAL|nr:hypothetical protein LUZ63_001610 [Rhynchospora breviuscula]
MSEASLRRRRSFTRRGSPIDHPVRVSLTRRSQQPRKKRTSKILPRCASEPVLWIVQLVPDDVVFKSDKEEPPPLFIDPTFFSCHDIFEFSSQGGVLPRQLDHSEEERKVLVSVTVEGSVGPIKALVRLGASVEEAIKAVLLRYRSEGRSPPLDSNIAGSFQLHHSHFSLESLNNNDKIGEVGGRSFYLRKNCETNDSYSGTQEHNLVIKQSADFISNVTNQAFNTSQSFMLFIIKKFNKIKRRTIRLWRVVTCDNCS